MKLRSGFVSNSSSSSFILGYGLIKDMKKLEEYFEENKIEFSYDIESFANVRVFSCWHIDKHHRILSCTNYKELIVPLELEYANGYLLLVELGNDEGDSEFTELDYNGNYLELNWERAENINFWSGYQRALIKLFDNVEIIDKKNSRVIYGAERNG